jgi:divalent metal cation (Fe/Co/Zn/Cd) transporter
MAAGGRFLLAEERLYRRRVLIIVGIIGGLTLGQSAYALLIGNRFLLKDAIDWSYDIALWLVALAVFGRGRRAEDVAALGVGLIMLVAGAHTAYELWDKIATGRRPEIWVAGWSSVSAVMVGILVVGLLARFRSADNPLILATWLSSRNAMISTTAYAIVGFFARTATSQTPEILLDLFAIALNWQAAGAVFLAVRRDWGMRRRDDGQALPGVASSRE